jgi:hypothetical protein
VEETEEGRKGETILEWTRDGKEILKKTIISHKI